MGKNSGFRFPVSRLTVNLAPADKKKTGTVYDLPILVGILAAAGDLPKPAPDTGFGYAPLAALALAAMAGLAVLAFRKK